MKKYLLWSLVLALVIVPTVWAQTTMTREQIMAEISRLTAILEQLRGAPKPTPCPATFTRDLTVGSEGEDVNQLAKILRNKGFLEAGKDWYSFTEDLAAAVVKYQVAVGISPASGYFGPVTRAHLNAVIGCSASAINVSLPNEQSIYHPGDTVAIRWTSRSDVSDLVRIRIVGPIGKEWSPTGTADIIQSTNNDGEYDWTIPADSYKLTANYRIDVIAKDNSDIGGKSGVFIISDSASQPSITILTPNGGEIWPAGGTAIIRWNSSGLGSDTVNIELTREKNVVSRIASKVENLANSGIYEWAIDKDLAPGQYLVRISQSDNLNINDYSDSYFTITSDTAPPLTILTPKENETYDVGDKLKITWTPKKSDIKQIALICSGTCSSDYLVYQPRSSWFRTSSGVRNYRIPRSGFEPGYYRVRITLNDGTIAESPIIRILGQATVATRTPLTRQQARPSPYPVTQEPSQTMQTPETGSVCALGVNNSGWGSGSSQSTRDYCSSAKAGGWAVRCLKGPSLRAYQVPISTPGQSGDQICASSGGVCTELNSNLWGQKYCDDTTDTYGWSARCVIGSGLSAFSTNNEAGQSGDQACAARSAKCVSVNNNLWGHKYCYETNPEAGWSVRCVQGEGLSAADANTSSTNRSGDQVCAARVAQTTSVKQTASVWQAIRCFFLGR